MSVGYIAVWSVNMFSVCCHVRYICCWQPNIPISTVSIKPLIKQTLCSVCYWAWLSVSEEIYRCPCCVLSKINQSINQSVYMYIYVCVCVHTNSCAVIRQDDPQTCSKPATCFDLFRPSSGTYSTKKSTVIGGYICIVTVLMDISDITKLWLYFSLLNAFLKMAETCSRLTTCLCIIVSNYGTVVGVYIYTVYIQGVPGGMWQTLGECSLGQTIPI